MDPKPTVWLLLLMWALLPIPRTPLLLPSSPWASSRSRLCLFSAYHLTSLYSSDPLILTSPMFMPCVTLHFFFCLLSFSESSTSCSVFDVIFLFVPPPYILMFCFLSCWAGSRKDCEHQGGMALLAHVSSSSQFHPDSTSQSSSGLCGFFFVLFLLLFHDGWHQHKRPSYVWCLNLSESVTTLSEHICGDSFALSSCFVLYFFDW